MSDVKPVLEDLNVIVAGQGGDGSLTVVNVLADVLRGGGLRVYTERDVLSRIKGGITAATLRAYNGERLCISSHIDLLVAFDQLAVPKYAFRLNSQSIVIYDSSNGELPEGHGLPEGVRLIPVPLSRYAVKNFRRDIYKNSISFAVIGRLIGLQDDEMEKAFVKRFTRRGAQAVKYNLEALCPNFKQTEAAYTASEFAAVNTHFRSVCSLCGKKSGRTTHDNQCQDPSHDGFAYDVPVYP